MIPFLSSNSGLLSSRDRAFALQVRTTQARKRNWSDAELRAQAESLRESTVGASAALEKNLVESFALAAESLRRTHEIDLYDVQLVAAQAMATGRIAEMQTGEGKTFTALPAAVHASFSGRGVHVTNPNTYLTQRDWQTLQPAFELLGMSSGILPTEDNRSEKHCAYSADVTYGSGCDFGFDYLRDQLGLHNRSQRSLGDRCLDRLTAAGPTDSDSCQRGLAFTIVDEADSVLVDDAISPLVLAESSAGPASDEAAIIAAHKIACQMLPSHYEMSATESVSLSASGNDWIHGHEVTIPVSALQKPWATYVETALAANKCLQKNVQYVVNDSKVQIVDATTGRIYEDRTWQNGLHQAVEAKESLKISSEQRVLATITRQRFSALYSSLAGMTGTATGCAQELASVYGLTVKVIPPRLKSQRIVHPMRSFVDQSAKWTAIAESIANQHTNGRPVLVGTRTIAESIQLADALASRGLNYELLNGCQHADEAEIVSCAGQIGAITIATNLAGRGTDIKLSSTARDLGGLHVIVSECHPSQRMDRQLVGRCARQGNAGSAQTFIAADDWLLRNHAPWLSKRLLSMGRRNGEIAADLTSRIQRVQASAQRSDYATRASLLRADRKRTAMMG